MQFFPELKKAKTDFHKTNIVLNANVFTDETLRWKYCSAKGSLKKAVKHRWKITWETDTEKLKLVFSFSGKLILF